MVRRDPTMWERLKGGLGAKVNLETGEVENELEATAVVDSTRRSLAKLGVTNALSLVIDDTTIFSDTQGRPDDLGDLILALSEHASVFGRGFKELRFAAEHEEAGVHMVIETRARTKHLRDEPAAIVSVGGRIRALEPSPGETADAYQARVEPLVKQAGMLEASRLAFESFVQRLQAALAAALPEAQVVLAKTESRLVKPRSQDMARPEQGPAQPMAPGYDPFVTYYPSPMGMMLDMMMFSTMMHMMMPSPMMLYSSGGAPIASLADVQAEPSLASDDNIAYAEQTAAHDYSDDMSSVDEGGSVWDAAYDGDGGGGFESSDGGGWDGGDSGGGFGD